MSMVSMIDAITAWAQAEICNHVTLKKPPETDDEGKMQEAKGYNEQYETVNPSALPIYVPGSERENGGVIMEKEPIPIPSLCVGLIQGSEGVRDGTVKIRFGITVWNPGNHGLDFFKPQKDGSYRNWNNDEAKKHYERRATGWKDAWNFADQAIRALRNTHRIKGYEIVKENGIEYGPYSEAEEIPDYYPFWFAWVSFFVRYPVMPNNPELQQYL